MAVTITEVEPRNPMGSYWEHIVDVTFDTSYPTGGEALSSPTSSIGMTDVLAVTASPAAGFVFEYIKATDKLKAYWVDTTVDGAALAEVPNGTDLHTVTTRLVVRGR